MNSANIDVSIGRRQLVYSLIYFQTCATHFTSISFSIRRPNPLRMSHHSASLSVLLHDVSSVTNMLCFLEDVTKWVDEGSPVDIIYLDF